jgi:hypothetical protein
MPTREQAKLSPPLKHGERKTLSFLELWLLPESEETHVLLL